MHLPEAPGEGKRLLILAQVFRNRLLTAAMLATFTVSARQTLDSEDIFNIFRECQEGRIFEYTRLIENFAQAEGTRNRYLGNFRCDIEALTVMLVALNA